MSDVIATVWDFDKTLISGYMQDPIFRHYNVEPKEFWDSNDAEIKQHETNGLVINHDSYYLNKFIRMSAKGQPFDGLNNDKLKEFGQQLDFFEGAIDLFTRINQLNEEQTYRDFGIRFENYIVSTGFKKMIEGSAIAELVTHIWGAELIDTTDQGEKRLSEIAYSLDNTTKTRALFEINKGVGIVKGSTIDVNTKIAYEDRRVQFCNMIYVADGPSDVPAFSVMNKHHGATLAVYPHGDRKALHEVEKLRRAGRVQMIAEANYTEKSTASMWIMERLMHQAKEIMDAKKAKYTKEPGTPRHLI